MAFREDLVSIEKEIQTTQRLYLFDKSFTRMTQYGAEKEWEFFSKSLQNFLSSSPIVELLHQRFSCLMQELMRPGQILRKGDNVDELTFERQQLVCHVLESVRSALSLWDSHMSFMQAPAHVQTRTKICIPCEHKHVPAISYLEKQLYGNRAIDKSSFHAKIKAKKEEDVQEQEIGYQSPARHYCVWVDPTDSNLIDGYVFIEEDIDSVITYPSVHRKIDDPLRDNVSTMNVVAMGIQPTCIQFQKRLTEIIANAVYTLSEYESYILRDRIDVAHTPANA